MKITRFIISITIPFFLLILFASILTTKPYLTISKGLYDSHDEIDFDHDYAVDRIIGYLNYRYDDLDFGANEFDSITLLRDVEIRHMVDVKNLYTSLRVAAIISIITAVALSILLYRVNKKELYVTFKNIYKAPVFFILFVGGYLIIDFNAAFTAFHKLLFTNGDWLLYRDDVLIRLLPTNFWMVSGLIILFLFALSLALIYFINERIFKKDDLV